MKLAIASDAISHDFETAVLLGLEWGIECFELKRTHPRKRIAEVDSEDIERVAGLLEAHCVSLSSLSPGLFKVTLDPVLVAPDMTVKFESTVSIAHRLHVQSVVIFGFMRDDSLTEAEAIPRIVDLLGDVSRRAEEEGLTLFLENERGSWVDDPRLLTGVVSGVNSEALRINWDPCNLIGAYRDPPFPVGYDLVRDLVGHVHVKDARVESGRVEHAMVGVGAIDWVGQFERLYRDGYSGYCVLEPHFGGRVVSSRDHILATRRLLRQARVNAMRSDEAADRGGVQKQEGNPDG